MDNRSIGVFDSGLGGLTAVKQIMAELPNESIVYFGDTGRVPYGSRSRETIIKYSKSDINFLLSKDVKLIVVACGTVSSVALPVLKSTVPITMIGVVEAAASAAIEATKNNRIGVIGTKGTIKSGAYEKYIALKNPEIKTFSKACPLFVPLVENGHFDTMVAELVVEEYLTEIKESGIDTLILGCTHYPLLKNTIARFMGDSVTLIDAGAEVAKLLKKTLEKEDILAEKPANDQFKYYVSDDVDGFESLGGMFLERTLSNKVEKIDIEKY
ncbi:MAG: glutamate racemase [Clostridia bacterium]|nr:glutamate racemase [Clostridia bacterium]